MPGKVVIITGGAKGIGAATAEEFVRRDWRVAMLDLTFDERPKVPSDASRVLVLETDVCDRGSVQQSIDKAAKHFGRIDALVNNAGIQRWSSLEDMEIDTWRKVMETNFFGSLFCMSAAGKHMVTQGAGAIVNVLSIMAERGAPMRGPYSASKAALQAVTRTAAVEWGKKGIRVNGIGPGYIETPLMTEYFESGQIDKCALEALIPLGRVGRPAEIAKVIYFLASDDSSYVTGQTVFVDGGFLSNSGVE
jgi:3-oxoacyl-[acyl-carrier protein] reductase